MTDIILSTLNAKYTHTSLALRYIMANMEELQDRSQILEFMISSRPMEIVEKIINKKPKIVTFGVYIWNAEETLKVVTLLKKIRPELIIVIGGPEVTYEYESKKIFNIADYLVCGEGDFAVRDLCKKIINGETQDQKVIIPKVPEVSELKLPYDYYTDDDIKNRYIYVEASRGCPFTCEFCLSSLDKRVREFDLDLFLNEMKKLWSRGARSFKFIDRTFNLKISNTIKVLNFFLQFKDEDSFFLHFEVIPDRFPDELKEVIKMFPSGTLQFEIGIQTLNKEVAERIGRKLNFEAISRNLRFLMEETDIHIHSDLIIGLPGESFKSFGESFDKLFLLGPQEIQVGLLKRLNGTKISRHDIDWDMVYNPYPPYTLLKNRHLSFDLMQDLTRFARYWDLVHNNGNFSSTSKLIWKDASPFHSFFRFTKWLYENCNSTHSISLDRLAEFLFRFLTEDKGLTIESTLETVCEDFMRIKGRKIPKFIHRIKDDNLLNINTSSKASTFKKRQDRHNN